MGYPLTSLVCRGAKPVYATKAIALTQYYSGVQGQPGNQLRYVRADGSIGHVDWRGDKAIPAGVVAKVCADIAPHGVGDLMARAA